MKAIALAFKDYEVNPFTGRCRGELMIVHQCVNCGHISPNRIAGDDNEDQIISLILLSLGLDEYKVRKIKNLGIDILTSEKKEAVLITLFGTNYKERI